MKSILNLFKGSVFDRLLLVCALTAVLFAMAAPGAVTVKAANPNAAAYIIVFKDTVNVHADVPEIAKAYGLQTGFIYEHALKGMSAVVPAGRLAALQHDPRVVYVVEDLQREISAQEVPTGIRRIFASENSSLDIDSTDDWRVDVDVAVIDTGVDLQHPDLNVVGGVNCTVSIFRPRCDPGGDDDHYHGTHVAGTIGALDNGIGVVGVAPGARIWAVKVLNKQGSGWSSWIIAGIDWVAANSDTIEVANMSLGGAGFSQAEYDAIQGAVEAGVAFAVAAGNEDDDANNYSPGGFDNVLSVSALADFDGLPGGLGSSTCRTDQDDTLTDFSNWGSEVDIAAPGVCILSTYPLEKGEYGTISGTSMASPHVAGALALLSSVNNPAEATDVYFLYNQVKSAGNLNWTDDSGDGIKEPLLDVSTFTPKLVPGEGGVIENQPPTAGFSYRLSNLDVTFTNTSTDLDGSVVSWNWNFGDATTSNLQNPTHAYDAAGTYTVVLTVTDNDNATGFTSQTVTVTSSSSSDITLTVTTRLVKTNKFADLSWSGALTSSVDIYRNGILVTTTANDGAYTDRPPKSVTSATYKVCDAGSSACSNQVTVSW